jgi:hypothetical protein
MEGLEDQTSEPDPRTVRWERVGACCSSRRTNGSAGGNRKSPVVDTLSHLVSDRSS